MAEYKNPNTPEIEKSLRAQFEPKGLIAKNFNETHSCLFWTVEIPYGIDTTVFPPTLCEIQSVTINARAYSSIAMYIPHKDYDTFISIFIKPDNKQPAPLTLNNDN